MRGSYWSVFCRKKLTIADPSALKQLILSVNYDDGFVAYLNGTEVARSNMTATNFNSAATASHEAGAFEEFDLSGFKGLLAAGPGNVLAVPGPNNTPSSTHPSFLSQLFSPEGTPAP